MKIMIVWIGVLLLGTSLPAVAFEKDYDEGIDYEVLPTEQPTETSDKVEVLEFFLYTCSHCGRLYPILENWLKTQPEYMEFRPVPAVFRDSSIPYAKAYYTADLLGVVEAIHGPLFEAIHGKHRKFSKEQDWEDFFVERGVDREAFRQTFNSFAVYVKVKRAAEMTQRYGITGVPTLIVNGKYRTSASLTGTQQAALKVVEYLVEKENNKRLAAAREKRGG